MNKKVRNAQLAQFNFIFVVGEKEQSNRTANSHLRQCRPSSPSSPLRGLSSRRSTGGARKWRWRAKRAKALHKCLTRWGSALESYQKCYCDGRKPLIFADILYQEDSRPLFGPDLNGPLHGSWHFE